MKRAENTLEEPVTLKHDNLTVAALFGVSEDRFAEVYDTLTSTLREVMNRDLPNIGSMVRIATDELRTICEERRFTPQERDYAMSALGGCITELFTSPSKFSV
jgi:hypothetical protein